MNETSSPASSTSAHALGLTAEAISRRAYELWEQEGRPEGRDLHHWLRAEQLLVAERAQPQSSPVSPSRPGAATPPPSTARATTSVTRDVRAPKRNSTPAPFASEKSAAAKAATNRTR